MTKQTDNTNDLVINPNDNDQFVDDVRMNEFTHTNEENAIEEPEQTTPKQGSKIGILYAIIVFLIIVGTAFYAYTFHRDFVAHYIPCLQTEEQINTAEQTDAATDLQTESATGDAVAEVESNESNEIDYTSTETASVSDEAVADAITESMLQDAAQQQSAKTKASEAATPGNTATQTDFRKALTRPAWIISVSSVAKETIAVARVKELRSAGNAADYYWIPDYVNGGNRYFKVFVGPFATKAEAQNYLSSHELAADAYILKVE